MENFIIMIASLAPGFVGIAVQKLLNGDTTSGAVQGNIMIYFLYAASSLLCAELVFWFHGPISKLLMNEPIQLVDILVPMEFALIIAVFWHIIGARLAKMFANGINKIAGKNSIMMDADMLETMLNDNQAHFLEVSFPDGTEKNGYVTNVIVSTREIMLEPEPEWTKDYNRHTKRTCINLNSGIVITEYEYK